jgi:uncharacterized protein YodC (DUF2158 family)
MSDEQFKVKDCVQLLHGYTPTMTIAEIFEETQMAKCVWYDRIKKKTHVEDIPISALKHCPDRPDVDDIRSAAFRL